MRLGSPALLLAWLLLPLLAVLIGLAMARQRALLRRLGSIATVRRLAASASLQRRAAKATLVLAGLALLILALARPQWGRIAEPLTRQGVDVIIALDVSESMRARDVTPERFARAGAFTRELVTRLEGNRIGLVAFAGTAFTQCPLTLDLSAVRLFLDILEVGDVPDPGSNLEEGIRVALTAFPESGGGRRVLVLLTDGEDHEGRAREAAAAAAEEGVVIYTVGVGTAGGGPIPLVAPSGDGGYRKDGSGRVITTRLMPDHLHDVAVAGGGRFMIAGGTLGEAERLAEEIDRMEKADISSRLVLTHKERFQLPLALALLLLLAEMLVSPSRRGAGGLS